MQKLLFAHTLFVVDRTLMCWRFFFLVRFCFHRFLLYEFVFIIIVIQTHIPIGGWWWFFIFVVVVWFVSSFFRARARLFIYRVYGAPIACKIEREFIILEWSDLRALDLPLHIYIYLYFGFICQCARDGIESFSVENSFTDPIGAVTPNAARARMCKCWKTDEKIYVWPELKTIYLFSSFFSLTIFFARSEKIE